MDFQGFKNALLHYIFSNKKWCACLNFCLKSHLFFRRLTKLLLLFHFKLLNLLKDLYRGALISLLRKTSTYIYIKYVRVRSADPNHLHKRPFENICMKTYKKSNFLLYEITALMSRGYGYKRVHLKHFNSYILRVKIYQFPVNSCIEAMIRISKIDQILNVFRPKCKI